MKKALAYEIIRELRQKNGLSQKELADRVGLTQQAIALLESNKRKLEFDLFINILDKMNVSQQELRNIINDIYIQPSNDINPVETHDDINDYIHELGEFLYYNPQHKPLFDSVMDVKSADIQLAKQMLDRINGKE